MRRAPYIFSILIAFIFNSIGLQVHADELSLPKPGTLVHLSPAFNPPILKGIKVHVDNPFRFDFILDRGDSPTLDKEGVRGRLQQESKKLIKYFLASLTIPEKDLWVNLSPYEKDRIISHAFGQTEMGRDLLAQDYMLKQITASLIYPEDEIGKKFWKRVYEEATKKFGGSTTLTINTFNKVWIVPEKAVVYENAKAGTAYVVESRLKVMLEQDYLAESKLSARGGSASGGKVMLEEDYVALNENSVGAGFTPAQNNRATARVATTNRLGSQIIREIIIPQLTKEINTGKNFAQLRQVYNSLILATWYKKKIKDSILSQVYLNKNKIAGVNINDPQEKQKIYERYLQAFKKGAYNYIKEEIDPVTQQMIPRKYFSGGLDMAMTYSNYNLDHAALAIGQDSAIVRYERNDNAVLVDINIKPVNVNQQSNPLLARNREMGRRLLFGAAASIFSLFALPMVSIAREKKSEKKRLIDQFLGKNYNASTEALKQIVQLGADVEYRNAIRIFLLGRKTNYPQRNFFLYANESPEFVKNNLGLFIEILTGYNVDLIPPCVHMLLNRGYLDLVKDLLLKSKDKTRYFFLVGFYEFVNQRRSSEDEFFVSDGFNYFLMSIFLSLSLREKRRAAFLISPVKDMIERKRSIDFLFSLYKSDDAIIRSNAARSLEFFSFEEVLFAYRMLNIPSEYEKASKVLPQERGAKSKVALIVWDDFQSSDRHGEKVYEKAEDQIDRAFKKYGKLPLEMIRLQFTEDVNNQQSKMEELKRLVKSKEDTIFVVINSFSNADPLKAAGMFSIEFMKEMGLLGVIFFHPIGNNGFDIKAKRGGPGILVAPIYERTDNQLNVAAVTYNGMEGSQKTRLSGFSPYVDISADGDDRNGTTSFSNPMVGASLAIDLARNSNMSFQEAIQRLFKRLRPVDKDPKFAQGLLGKGGLYLDRIIGGDNSMLPNRSSLNKGGIDLGVSDKVLAIQNDGQTIKFYLDPAQLAQWQNASGITFDILNIQPMNHLREFLGLKEDGQLAVKIS